MKKLFCLVGVLVLVSPAWGVYVARISDLQYSPTPPNPIRVAGRVVSENPLKLTDGRAEITVAGTSASASDFLVVTGDWDGSVLTVAGAVDNIIPPAVCEMIYIPAGSFLMGNNGNEWYPYSWELPLHPVYLSGYWIGKYEVTRGDYRRFMEAGGYSNPAHWSGDGWHWKVSISRTEPDYWAAQQDWYGGQPFTQTDAHPVVGVTYYEAEAYCAWAEGRLPTEAQWEKAARWDGTPRVYPWGDVWDAEKCNSWHDTNPVGGGYQRYQTAPVGSYPAGASPYGLHDMAGNVWEWCKDWYSGGYYSISPSVDPQGPTSGNSRVLRGGSWSLYDYFNRCAYRAYGEPYGLESVYGFRIAR